MHAQEGMSNTNSTSLLDIHTVESRGGLLDGLIKTFDPLNVEIKHPIGQEHNPNIYNPNLMC